MYTVCSLQHTVYCILYNVYSRQYRVCSIHYAVYSMQFTAYCILHTVYSIQNTVYCVLHTVYSIHRLSVTVCRPNHMHWLVQRKAFRGANAPRCATASSLSRIHDHTQTLHSRQDSFGRVINSSQRPLSDDTQHSQQTNIHTTGGIRTHNLSRWVAADRTTTGIRLVGPGSWYSVVIFHLHIFICVYNINLPTLSVRPTWRRMKGRSVAVPNFAARSDKKPHKLSVRQLASRCRLEPATCRTRR